MINIEPLMQSICMDSLHVREKDGFASLQFVYDFMLNLCQNCGFDLSHMGAKSSWRQESLSSQHSLAILYGFYITTRIIFIQCTSTNWAFESHTNGTRNWRHIFYLFSPVVLHDMSANQSKRDPYPIRMARR